MFFLASQVEQRAVLFIYFPKQLLGDLSFIDGIPWLPNGPKGRRRRWSILRGMEVEGRPKRAWICVYIELIHFVIQQNLA